MHIYFDESYDRRHRYLLLGALFVPGRRRLHRQITALKQEHRSVAPGHLFRDLKYSAAGDRYVSAACRAAVDRFAQSNAYFRSIALDTQMPGFDWAYFGGPETASLTKAYAYNKFAELLLRFNLGGIKNAVFLADWLTRAPGDNFVQYIYSRFGSKVSYPTFELEPGELRHVQEVDTKLEQYQVGQICDILLGCVLGDLVPPTNKNKITLIDHVKNVIGVPSFRAEFWRRYPKYVLDVRFPKFQVWHWVA